MGTGDSGVFLSFFSDFCSRVGAEWRLVSSASLDTSSFERVCAPMQVIASPFSFDRLLEGIRPTPYVFSHVAPSQQQTRATLQKEGAKVAVSMSLAQLTAAVRAQVHNVLGAQVCIL